MNKIIANCGLLIASMDAATRRDELSVDSYLNSIQEFLNDNDISEHFSREHASARCEYYLLNPFNFTRKSPRFYIVTTRSGHVGKGHYIATERPIIAYSKEEAVYVAVKEPRSKTHNTSDCICVIEVSKEEYLEADTKSKNDPYNYCKNHSEQVLSVPDYKVRREKTVKKQTTEERRIAKSLRKERIAYQKKKEETLRMATCCVSYGD